MPAIKAAAQQYQKLLKNKRYITVIMNKALLKNQVLLKNSAIKPKIKPRIKKQITGPNQTTYQDPEPKNPQRKNSQVQKLVGAKIANKIILIALCRDKLLQRYPNSGFSRCQDAAENYSQNS